MAWRVAGALEALLVEINDRAPNRSKASDGSIGDSAHASRTSDHNPWVDGGVVTARDFTHDPNADADMNDLAEHLRGTRDDRVKYVIWDGRMFSSYPTSSTAAWQWRPYTGSNRHEKHLHLSVQPSEVLYDSTDPWGWDDMALTDNDVEKIADAVLGARYADGTTVRGAIRSANKRTEKILDLVEALGAGDTVKAKAIAASVREELSRALED